VTTDRDVIIPVRLHGEAVELLERHARPAGARLKVVRSRCRRDKRLVASAAGAHHGARPVQLGVQVVPEVAFALETPVTLGAVDVHLVVVLLEFRIAVE